MREAVCALSTGLTPHFLERYQLDSQYRALRGAVWDTDLATVRRATLRSCQR